MNMGKINIVQRADSTLTIDIKTNEKGEVWATSYEIADLLQVFTSSISSNLKAMFRDKQLYEDEVTKEVNRTVYYNLEVIIALAFRCKGPICKKFCQWVCCQAKRPYIEQKSLIIQMGKEVYLA